MKLVVSFVLLFLLIDVPWCRSECIPSQCLQSIDPFSCPEGTWYQEKVSMGECCPGCVRFRGLDESCEGDSAESFDLSTYYTSRTYITTGQQQPIIQSQKCVPGMKCSADGKCLENDKYKCPSDSDIKFYAPEWRWRPSCDIDGSYAAVQCKTGTQDRCFCYNKKGERIFGFDWDTPENRKNMQCLCSRLVDEQKNNAENQDTTFHCSSNGNFEPLQCNRGMCYCADIFTGQPTSFMVPESLWLHLPCYNSKTMGSKYLKKCDSQTNALALINQEMKRHGSKLDDVAPSCDPDGSFKSKQCEGSQCFCKMPDNSNTGYFTERNTPGERTQKCYCARDQLIYQSEGKTHNYLCDNGGNYRPLQIINEEAFCVDEDGYKTTGEVPEEDLCTLKCSDTSQLC